MKIVYDDDVFGARILAEVPTGSSEDESYVCNHLIAMQTVLSDDLVWSALDFSTDPPTQKSFRVEFDDNVVSAEFKDMFAEGKILQGVQKRRTKSKALLSHEKEQVRLCAENGL